VSDSIEQRLDRLEEKATYAEDRLAHLSVVSEFVLVVQECLIDIADAIEELGGQAPAGLNGRLERLEQLSNQML
jgi:uncharacterized coiled-coil protein SlyX